MTTGLFVEDEHRFNRSAIQHLAIGLCKNCKVDTGIIAPEFMSQADMLKGEYVEKRLKAFLMENSGCAKVILVRDCECRSAEEMERLNVAGEKMALALSTTFGIPVRFVLCVHAFESWLMQCPKAISAVLGQSVMRKLPADPESECRPKDKLKSLSKSYISTSHNVQIAQFIDDDGISEIVSRSKSFEKFKNALKD